MTVACPLCSAVVAVDDDGKMERHPAAMPSLPKEIICRGSGDTPEHAEAALWERRSEFIRTGDIK